MLLSAPPSVDLRLLTADDWTAVAEIYWDGMRGGLATFETEVPSWETWDAEHLRDHRLVATLLGDMFRRAPVSYIATVPGSAGPTVALLSEIFISLLMMSKSRLYPDGLANSSGQLGRHFIPHFTGGVQCFLDDLKGKAQELIEGNERSHQGGH